jgi:hypothetical protein
MAREMTFIVRPDPIVWLVWSRERKLPGHALAACIIASTMSGSISQ